MWEVFFETLLNCGTADIAVPPPLGNLRQLLEEQIGAAPKGLMRVGLMKQTIAMYQQIRQGTAP